MSKTLALAIVLVLTVSGLVMFLPVKAQSRMLVVPDDYPTITMAIANAAEGDTILVKKGIYEEHSLVIDKTLTLIGEGKTNTIIKDIDPSILSYETFFPLDSATIRFDANDVTIANFKITGGWKGIDGKGNGTKITDNIVIAEGGRISLEGFNQTIERNIIENIPELTGGFTGWGIYIKGYYNKIVSNYISGACIDGIKLQSESSFNIVYNNTISNAAAGIIIIGNENIIGANNITGGSLHIPDSDSSNNLIFANRLNGNEAKLNLKGFKNTFYANELLEVEIGNSTAASNNTFYCNNFFGAPPHFTLDSGYSPSLLFDNGKEGNYWIGYNGTDTNDDGIGDQPYKVTATYFYYDSAVREEAVIDCGEDNFPLMAPFDIASVAVKLPDWASLDFQSEQSISVISPENRTYNFTNISLNFTVPQYTVKVLYSLDGKENVTITGNTTITGLSNGLHNITVYAQDTFGNIGSSQTISFTVAKPEPDSLPVVLVAAVSVVAIALVAAGLLVYHKKTKGSLVNKV